MSDQPHDTESRRALHELIDLLGEVDRRWASPEWNLHTADDVVGAHRALMHMLQWGLVGLFERDPAAPRFHRIVGPDRKLLGDNPDAVYFDAPVSAGHAYRVTGDTRGATYVSITVESGEAWGSMDNQVVGVLNDESFDIDPDGRFEIHLGGEPRERNWLALPDGAGSISTRHYFEDATHAAADPARVPEMRIEVIHPGGDSRDSGGDSRDSGGDSRDSGGDSRDSGGDSRDSGGDSRDSGGDSRDSGGDSRDSDGDSRDSGGDSRDSGGDSRDSGGDSRDSDGDSDGDSRDSGGDSRDSGGDSRDSGGDSRDSGGDSRDSRDSGGDGNSDGNPATTPPPRPSDATVAAGIRRVAGLVRELTVDRPPTGQSQPRSWISRVPNVFPPPGKPGDLGLAAFDAAYAMAPFAVGPDEALVIRARWPHCRYANVCLWNRHLQTFDYANRSISLNRAQTVADADGRFTAVIAHTDPGVRNWLDTEGRPFGIVYWRFMLPEGEIETPQAELVPLSDLPSIL